MYLHIHIYEHVCILNGDFQPWEDLQLQGAALRNSELLTADLLQLDAVLLSDSCERSWAVKTQCLAVAGASSHISDQQANDRVLHQWPASITCFIK